MAAGSTIASLKVALDLDKRKYDAKLRKAKTDAEKTKVGLERIFGRLALGAAAVAGVTAAVRALGKFTQAGGRASTVQAAFAKSMGNSTDAIAKLRAATRGMVDDVELMTQANMALTLGSANNADQFAQLATTAQELGRALGLDTAFALNSLNVGIARQSRLVLDNLGLIVSVEQANRKYADAIGKTVAQLSDAEKKEAFRIEAMTAAEAKLRALGTSSRNAGDAYSELTVELKNTVTQLQLMAANSGNVESFFTESTRFIRIMRFELEQATTASREFWAAQSDPMARIVGGKTTGGRAGGDKQGPTMAAALLAAAEDTAEFRRQIELLENAMLPVTVGAINPLTGALEDFGDASHLLGSRELPEIKLGLDGVDIAARMAQLGFLSAASGVRSLRQELQSLNSVISGIGGILSIFGFAGGAGLFGKVSQVLGIGSMFAGLGGGGGGGSHATGIGKGVGLKGGLGAFGARGGASTVNITLVGQGAGAAASTLTLHQNRAGNLRQVARVPVAFVGG